MRPSWTEILDISEKSVYLQCVFHSIRFKVNKKDWLSGIDSLFFEHISTENDKRRSITAST